MRPHRAKEPGAAGLSPGAIAQHEKAVAHYDKAIRRDPKDANAYNDRGIALMGIGRHAEALACFVKALECCREVGKLDRRHAEICFNKGVSLALVDFSDQITKIYHQGASMAQLTFERPCGGRHTLECRDEMRRDRIWRRS